MTKINFEESFKIYLFTGKEKTQNGSSLNEFISFLKFNKVFFPLKFSYVSNETGLIQKLSLIENIVMDFNAHSLTDKKQIQLYEFLKNKSIIKEFFNEIENPESFTYLASKQMKKITLLIKSFISETNFLFFEVPEEDLNEFQINLFIKILIEIQLENKQNIFIYSKNILFWSQYAQFIVTRDDHQNFIIKNTSSNLIELKTFKKPAPSFETNEEGLVFKWPKRLITTKKTA